MNLKPLKFKGFLFALLFLTQILPFATRAQEKNSSVTGVVHNAKNEPVVGVSVIARNTKTNYSAGATTDTAGLFTFSHLPAGGPYNFSFSAVGYQAQSLTGYTLKGNASLSLVVSMKDNAVTMDQVVVIGYGTRKRSDVTSSIVSISAEDIRSRPVQNALQAIQGKAAGVDITSNERPGEVGSILIRGVRSLAATNSPLYVVDGIPLNFGSINAINPNDIEAIDILKDASATAIYGSRGANGVVLITTKKGKNGTIALNYIGSVTVEKINDHMERMNSAQYIEFRRDAYRRIRYLNPAASANTTYPDKPTLADDQRIFGQEPYAWTNVQKGWANGEWDGSLVPTSDWRGMVEQTGITHDHTVSVSGGTQKMKAYASFGYLKQEGTQLGQDYTRYSGKFNIDINPLSWFAMGTSITATYGIQNFGFSTTNATGPGSLYGAASGMLPYAIPFDSSGKRINLPGGDINILNPIGEEQYNVNLRNTLRTLGAFYAEITPLKGLRYRVNFGPDFSNYKNGRWMDAMSINRGGGEPGSSNYAQLNQTSNIAWTLDNLLYYNKTLGGMHDIGATFLYSSTKEREETSTMTATKLPWNSQKWYKLSSVAALDDYDSGLSENSLLSYMGRINYAFKGKYFFDAYARWDGASPLAPGKKWDMFPAGSLAWRIDRENFMQSVPWINQLKLRLGVGSVGNAAITPYTTMGAVQTLYYTWGGVVEPGYVSSDPSASSPVTMPNPNLTWEHTTQTNLGLDFGFLKGRINGSLDLYTSRTEDLLMVRSIPTLTGYGRTYDNVGATANKGIELALNTINVQTPNFNWSSTLNFSATRDRIVELSQGKVDDLNNLWFIGQRLNLYYDYVKLGIWQNTTEDQAEMAKFNANIASANSQFKPGSIRVADLNGDYKIDANNDRKIVGHSQHNWTAGLMNEFNYKNWSLNFFIFSRWGYTLTGGAESLQGRFAQRLVDYWTPNNPTNNYPAPNYNSAAGDPYRSSMNYQNGSFIKVRNISLAYNLPKSISSKMKMTNARFYVQAMNPGLLYSKVDWVDPDVNASTSNRGIVFGVNAAF